VAEVVTGEEERLERERVLGRGQYLRQLLIADGFSPQEANEFLTHLHDALQGKGEFKRLVRKRPQHVLLAGDVHANLRHMRYLIEVAKAKNIDRIFQLGDFGYWEHEPAGVEYLDQVQALAEAAGVTVYFLDGNHDNLSLLLDKYQDCVDEEGFLKVRERIRYAPRGHRWTWAGVRFIALGGAYSVDKAQRLAWEKSRGKPESLWFPQEQMTDDDMARILLDNTPVDVILAHDKPLNSRPGWNRKDLSGCLPNQRRLQRACDALAPKLFVHGHLHYRYSDQLIYPGELNTTVEGLTCDDEATETYPYVREDSHLILRLDDGSITHSTRLGES